MIRGSGLQEQGKQLRHPGMAWSRLKVRVATKFLKLTTYAVTAVTVAGQGIRLAALIPGGLTDPS